MRSTALVLLALVLSGCRGDPAPRPRPAAPPADFAFSLAVVTQTTRSGGVRRAGDPVPGAPGSGPPPARYVVQSDMVLRLAQGPAALMEHLPRATRRLTVAEYHRLWEMVAAGAGDAGDPEPPPVPPGYYELVVTERGRTTTRRVALGAPAAGALTPLVEALGELAWVGPARAR